MSKPFSQALLIFSRQKKKVKKRPLKNIEEDGRPKKKKDGRKMGVYGKCAHQIKKKKMGVPKKKDGETPIFFLKFFGPHLSPIPTAFTLSNFDLSDSTGN